MHEVKDKPKDTSKHITILEKDIQKPRRPYPRQKEAVIPDRRSKRPDKGLPKSQKHRLEGE
jgi:hypothetical protein